MRWWKWLLLLIIVSTILGTSAYFYGSFASQTWDAQPAVASGSAQLKSADISVLVLDFNDRSGPITTLVTYKSNETALELLQRVAAQKHYAINIITNGSIQNVIGINTQKNTNQKMWKYTINGEENNTPVNKYILQAGDRISWKYVDAKN